jgi:peptide/nickel transport system permease protein
VSQTAEPSATGAPIAVARGSAPAAARRPRIPGPSIAIAAPALVIAAIALCALAPDWLSPYEPTDFDTEAILRPPSFVHWMGTDHFGRDVLSLVIHGARHSMLMGALAALLGAAVGGAIGLVCGYVGGALDLAAMRLVDLWLSIPQILLAILIATALGPGLGNTILAVGVAGAPRYARLMRAQAIAITRRPFIEAARAIGVGDASILLRHVLPHAFSPLLVMATFGVADAILTGAALGFIGLDVIDDRPDWGFLTHQGRGYITVAWWFATFPGLAITALVMSVNLVGDALRDRLDPHRHAR